MKVIELYNVFKKREYWSIDIYGTDGNTRFGHISDAYSIENIAESVLESEVASFSCTANSLYVSIEHEAILTKEENTVLLFNQNITYITQDQAEMLFSSVDEHGKYSFPYKKPNLPFGLGSVPDKFIVKENLLSRQIFTAIDNETGDAWTESFKTIEEAVAYLNGSSVSSVLNR